MALWDRAEVRTIEKRVCFGCKRWSQHRNAFRSDRKLNFPVFEERRRRRHDDCEQFISAIDVK